MTFRVLVDNFRFRVVGAVAAAALIGLMGAADRAHAGGGEHMAPASGVWQGLYGGLNVGYGESDVDFVHANNNWWTTGPNQNFPGDPDGFFAGGQVGFNQQMGGFVAGVELSYSAAAFSSRGPSPYFPTLDESRVEIEDLFMVTGRLGYDVFAGTLVYVKGGYASAEVTASNNDFVSGNSNFSRKSTRHSGWVFGVGVEKKVTEAISVGFEYNLIDLDAESVSLVNTGPSVGAATINANVDPDQVHAISFRMNIALTK